MKPRSIRRFDLSHAYAYNYSGRLLRSNRCRSTQSLFNRYFPFILCALSASALAAQTKVASSPGLTGNPIAAGFVRLQTIPFRGKQDDLFFIDRKAGWYGNGEGKLYKTVDGGASWDEEWVQPGTFIRALGFVSPSIGILGNVGTDYFPGVTDETPLYRTVDGGENWDPVSITGPMPKGICAIDVQRTSFINHGVLGEKITIWAAGRVGGPAYLLKSDDNGATFSSRDMSEQTGMILDVKFVSPLTGFLAGASDAAVETSHALVLRTTDGGKTWEKVYESERPWEITWKLSFPTPQTGYVTIQNYDQDPSNAKRFVAKTTDGGKHWSELPLVSDHKAQEFGVGFINTKHGWIGGIGDSFETSDGGRTWHPVNLGHAVNKFRIVSDKLGTDVFAIGSSVVKSTIAARP